MKKTLLRRVASLPILLLGISVLVFAIGRQVPGDPAVLYAGGERANPVVVEQIRAEYGLDRPLPVQYVRYVDRLAHGDLGYSFAERAPVREVLGDRLPATLELTIAALLLGTPAGLLLGILAARRRGSLIDHATTLTAIGGVSVPLFWAGLMLGWLFSVKLGWLPLGGRLPPFSDFEPITGIYSVDALLRADLGHLAQILRHLALPAMTLAIIPGSVLARFTRASFAEVFEQDYMRTARAYGLPTRTIVWRHAAKNAVLPLVTLFGLIVPALMAGAVLTESVFSWPGVGTLLFRALSNRDYAVVQAVTLIVGVCYVIANLIVDLSYSFLDPRTRR